MPGFSEEPAGRAVAHVFVDDLDEPSIADADRHHLERVLRLRVGETVTASDGKGGLRPCSYVAGGGLEPAGAIDREPAHQPSIGIGFALVKGERPEWIVQKLTECGVDRIIPFVAARSIVRWDEGKASRNLERLRTVAHEAAMQSRQRWLPTVDGLATFDQLVAAEGGSIARADFGGDDPCLEWPIVLVGPEGGWSPAEQQSAPRTVTLGPSVLRAETAAIAAGILLIGLRSGLVRPSEPRIPRS